MENNNKLYESIKKAHPEWSQRRVYAVTGSIMYDNKKSGKKNEVVRK